MHPFLLEIGRFRLPTYGVVSLCALLVAVLLIRRYARIEGLDPATTSEALVLTIAVGFFGARVFEALVDWHRYFGVPGGWKLLLSSTGMFFGGLITAIPFGAWWLPRNGIPVLVGLDILALTGGIAEGVGRWGCFFSGCCWGTPTHVPWAVTFPDAGRRLRAGLPSVPIHPTQIYMSLSSLVILGVLMLLYRDKKFDGRIVTVYLILYSISRVVFDFFRGDLDRGAILGGRLSTSQELALVLAGAGAVSLLSLSRRHRAAGEPDWRPHASLRASLRVLLLAVIVVAAGRAEAAASDRQPGGASGFAVRIIGLGGHPGDADTKMHLRFSRDLGFNAVLVQSAEAGTWTKDEGPDGPRLSESFLRFVKWSRKLGMDVWVRIDPGADAGERFAFTDADAADRIVGFAALLRRQADVRHVVLSFADQPMQNRELADVFEFGESAAKPELALAKRLAETLPSDVATWFCGSGHSNEQWGDPSTAYGKDFLDGIGTLPSGMGIVWSGPKPRSPKITRANAETARELLGGRPLLLDDGFPANDNEEDDAMALLLGALRGRDPGLREVVAGYLSRPELPLAGSRLSLLTIARFLNEPTTYDPDLATSAAVATLAGRNSEAATALTTQQMEWGGFIDGRNYWPRDELNPAATAERLHDPAFVSSFTWTVDRYPGRMSAISHVADRAFRNDLIPIMRRRLAIGRAIPPTIEYLQRKRAGSPDAALSLANIDAERHSWDRDSDASRILEIFLTTAGVPPMAKAP